MLTGEPKHSSGCEASACVTVRVDPVSGMVLVNDDGGNETSFTKDEWREFIAGAKRGEFDV